MILPGDRICRHAEKIADSNRREVRRPLIICLAKRRQAINCWETIERKKPRVGRGWRADWKNGKARDMRTSPRLRERKVQGKVPKK